MVENELETHMQGMFGQPPSEAPTLETPTIVAAPVETPVETPVVTPEIVIETPVVETEKPFFEVPDVFKTTETTPEVPKVELPVEATSKISELEQKLKEYENDEFIATWNKFKGVEGFDFKKLAQSMQGVDFGKMDLKDLVKMDIQSEYPELNGEDLDDEVNQFLAWKGVDEFTAKSVLSSLKKEYVSKFESTSKPNEYISQLEQAASKFKPVDNSAIEKEYQAVLQAEIASITNIADQVKGKEFMGMTIDESVLTPIIKGYGTNPYLVQDGSQYGKFDTNKWMQDQLKLATYDKVVNTAIEYGKKQALKERANIDPNGIGAGSGTPSVDTRSPMDIIKADLEAQRGY